MPNYNFYYSPLFQEYIDDKPELRKFIKSFKSQKINIIVKEGDEVLDTWGKLDFIGSGSIEDLKIVNMEDLKLDSNECPFCGRRTNGGRTCSLCGELRKKEQQDLINN